MKPEFWLERWQRSEIGFHRAEANQILTGHWHALGLAPGATVLVPLCGKSLDLGWLSRLGCDVFGVELSEVAVEAFFREAGLTPSRSRHGTLDLYEAGRLHVFRGDFFELGPGDLPPVAAAYDRAALIAMPPDLRVRYAEHMAELMPPAAEMLLVTLEYAEGSMAGPPFSVPPEEVEALYQGTFRIETLARRPAEVTAPRFRDRGLHATRDAVYRLTRH